MAISRNIVQAAIVSALLGDTNLSAYLSAAGASGEVAEASYRGTDFVLPAVRVSVSGRKPIGDGNARHTNSVFGWQIYVFSEEPSSKQAIEIASLIDGALAGHTLNVASGTAGVMDVDNITAPIDSSGLWQVLVTGTVRVAG